MPEALAGAMPASRRDISSRVPGRACGAADAGETLALGFDYGTRRIGVALGSTLTGAARPLRVIQAHAQRQWPAIAALIDEWHPDILVVGVARHPDGAPHQMTVRCERFARQLQGRFKLTVACVDERYSSAVLGGAQARDDAAAALILQQWLDEARAR